MTQVWKQLLLFIDSPQQHKGTAVKLILWSDLDKGEHAMFLVSL
jgi:hypothetical protein